MSPRCGVFQADSFKHQRAELKAWQKQRPPSTDGLLESLEVGVGDVMPGAS